MMVRTSTLERDSGANRKTPSLLFKYYINLRLKNQRRKAIRRIAIHDSARIQRLFKKDSRKVIATSIFRCRRPRAQHLYEFLPLPETLHSSLAIFYEAH